MLFMVPGDLSSGILIGLQNFKSQAMWNVVDIWITCSLPIVLLAFFNNSLLILIGWTTSYPLSPLAYLDSHSGGPCV